MSDIGWLRERPVAHRGLHDMNKTRWENTLSAFAAAVERDFTIECGLPADQFFADAFTTQADLANA